MSLIDVFRKQGGLQLIKQYNRAGVLGTALGEFLLLGKSRTSLEILRLSTQVKYKQKLEKEFRSTFEQFDQSYDRGLSHESSDKVWICWLQGIDNSPEIVQRCYESVKKNLIDREIVLITKENMRQYVQFPDYIIKKWNEGVITNTHLTDLLRLELLIRYGGLWLDATVFCSESRENIPDYFFDSDLFFFQSLKPGRDGKAIYISSWLMSAKTNNKVLMATRALCYEYWKKYNNINDYFLLHEFLSIVLDKYADDWKAIIPRDNSSPHILLLRLFDPYNEQLWLSIKGLTPFHKLTYKYSSEEANKEGTFFKKLFM